MRYMKNELKLGIALLGSSALTYLLLKDRRKTETKSTNFVTDSVVLLGIMGGVFYLVKGLKKD